MTVLTQFTGGGSSIKRIQRGTITMPSTGTTVTITLPFAVDPTKSVLNLNGMTSSSATGATNLNRFFYVDITGGGTTLTGTTNITAPSDTTAAWQIVEYN